MTLRAADILRFTSISEACISERVFAAQMDALEASGRPVVPLDALVDGTAPEGAICLTFDGGYRDFAEVAWPLLTAKGYPALLSIPTAKIGGVADWEGGTGAPLLDWDALRALAAEGAGLGVNGMTHRRLTALDEPDRDREILDARRVLQQEVGIAARVFAAPYGDTDFMTRRTIVSVYAANLGAALGSVDAKAQLSDLPRLDMTEFTNMSRWQAHLAGRGGFHLKRRALRRRIFGS